jgi:hypothetical protein
LFERLLPWLSIGKAAPVIRDLDDLDDAGLKSWLTKGLAEGKWTARAEAVSAAGGGTGAGMEAATATGDRPEHVLFFGVGAPSGGAAAVAPPVRVAVVALGDASVKTLAPCCEVMRFAMDDCLCRLLLRKEVYDAVSELACVPYDKAWTKLDRFATQLKENALPLRTSKRVLGLLRGIADFRASPASLATRILDGGRKALPEAELDELVRPIVRPIAFAANHLAPRLRPGD